MYLQYSVFITKKSCLKKWKMFLTNFSVRSVYVVNIDTKAAKKNSSTSNVYLIYLVPHCTDEVKALV